MTQNEIVGTSGRDTLRAPADTVAFGLGGDDALSAAPSDSFQFLLGGPGNDTYSFAPGEAGAVYDVSGADRLLVPGVPIGTTPTSFFATIEGGRHILFFNTENGTEVLWLDYRTSSIPAAVVGGITLDLPTIDFGIAGGLATAYVGDFTFDQIRDFGSLVDFLDLSANDFALPGSAEFKLVFADARARETQLLAGGGQGISTEDARLVAYLYEAGLDRDGNIDLRGLNFWIDALEAGLTERDLVLAFLESPEFREVAGEALDANDPAFLDDNAFVTELYENVLDRPADQPGLDFWLAALADPAVDRPALLIAFAESPENTAGSPQVLSIAEQAPGEWGFLPA